jgi:hypothetical protein
VLLICTRIPPSHSCRCELYSRYARILTRTVYCEPSGQLGEFTVEQRPSLGSSSSISDGSHSLAKSKVLFAILAKRRRGTKVLFAEQTPSCVALGRQRVQPGKVLGIAQRLTPEASQQPNDTLDPDVMSTHVHACPHMSHMLTCPHMSEVRPASRV